MELLIITQPHLYEGETAAVNRLFAQGCRRLHLRKPEASRSQTAGWLEQIEAQYRPRIVLHDHHDLAPLYHLGGIHLNSRNPVAPTPLAEGLTLSRSCHTIEEVKALAPDYDYVLLSPVFDSISKPGYRAAFTPEELESIRPLLSRNVYALGGITPRRLPEVERLGFHGAAMMGGVATDFIFDLGGVLLDLDMQRAAAACRQVGIDAKLFLSDTPGTSTLADGLSAGKLIADYQVGLVTSEQFLALVQRHCPPGTTPQTIVDMWNACIGTMPRHRLDLILQLRRLGYRTHLLSNTNQLHWDYIRRLCFSDTGYTCADLFDHVFLSQEVHLAKPDPAIYRHAVRQIGSPAGQCFFIDDSKVNVEAARREGLQGAWLDISRKNHLHEILSPFL